MRALITGAAGFVGRALVQRLAQDDRFKALVLLDSVASAEDSPKVVSLVGDLADPQLLAQATAEPVDLVVHLAGVMGGAAEADHDLSRRINLDASLNLVEAAARHGGRPRVVYTSTVAVFGAPLPARVDDESALAPAMTYGAHKLMMEVALADLHRRGLIEAVTLRLPGVLARPRGGQGMKSAFMSEIFHALAAGEAYVAPVSREATIWAMSRTRCVENLLHAARVEPERLPVGRAVTLPAVRPTFSALAEAIAAEVGVSADRVTYASDADLEAQFGRLPPLQADAAQAAGFASDGDVSGLVRAVLADITGDR